MRDFEKDLQGASAPDIRVDEFKRTLRRSLLNSMQATPTPGRRIALGATLAMATAFAVLLVVFVINPAVPARLHALVIGPDPAIVTQEPVAEADLEVREILSRINASPQVDQAFLESWYRQQSRQVEVKSVGSEKLLAFRQFELANGERVVVLTEVGDSQQRSAGRTATQKRTF